MKIRTALTSIFGSKEGIASIIREVNDPAGKLSSKRSAASALLFMAIYLASDPMSWKSVAVITLFTICGTILLYRTLKT